MEKSRLQEISFEIIAHAGTAFSDFYEAVEAAQEGNFEKADELMKAGEVTLNEAHNAQTELLAVEANGEDLDFSIFLIHAQDHLMTTIMYQRMAKQFIALCRKIGE